MIQKSRSQTNKKSMSLCFTSKGKTCLPKSEFLPTISVLITKLFFHVCEIGLSTGRKISSRPGAVLSLFEETTCETDFCGTSQIRRKITTEQTTSEM